LEISHELANAYQLADRWKANIDLQEAKLEAARERAAAVTADYNAGRTSIDLHVRAHAALTESAVAFQRSLAEYRKALAELNFRAGRLLESLNIRLAEGVWDPQAYRSTLARNLERVRGATPQSLKIDSDDSAEPQLMLTSGSNPGTEKSPRPENANEEKELHRSAFARPTDNSPAEDRDASLFGVPRDE
jgi:hypothetical protein